MFSGEAVHSSVAQSQAGLVMLVVFLLCVAAMAWLTVREASLYETRAAIRNLRRMRKPVIPAAERLSAAARFGLSVRGWMRGPDYREIFEQAPEAEFKVRLLAEIDKLAGKDVYHGQKEQL